MIWQAHTVIKMIICWFGELNWPLFIGRVSPQKGLDYGKVFEINPTTMKNKWNENGFVKVTRSTVSQHNIEMALSPSGLWYENIGVH